MTGAITPGLWKQSHPNAVAEKSSRFQPLRRNGFTPDGGSVWENDTYTVTVRRYENDKVFHNPHGMVQLGVCSADGTARHDWRDLQAIKNQLVGEDAEAFELFPAETRLMDPSNYYTLWCFPKFRIPVGTDIRRVWGQEEAFAPQRGFVE